MSTSTGFVDSLVVAVRENPLAAALIGGGAVWLLAGDEKLSGVRHKAAAVTSPILDSAHKLSEKTQERHAAPPTAPDLDHEHSFGFGDMMRHTGRAASNALFEASETIHDTLDEGAGHARDSLSRLRNPGKQAVMKTQSLLADIFERQPLALGAIGMAIGAAMAQAVPKSVFENEWIGEASDEAKADLNRRAKAVSESLNEASHAMKEELQESSDQVADRLKQVGAGVASAVQDRAKFP